MGRVKAVLLDRDGVICRNRPDHVKSWDEFEFLDDALRELPRLTDAGLKIAIVTNQAIIGRGTVAESLVMEINAKMCDALGSADIDVAGVYVCPHRPEDGCDCRKPAPGLIHQAASGLGVESSECCLVGDVYSDAVAGLTGGCRMAYLIPSSRPMGLPESEDPALKGRLVVAEDLKAAVSEILALAS